jgi:hypothetical protein
MLLFHHRQKLKREVRTVITVPTMSVLIYLCSLCLLGKVLRVPMLGLNGSIFSARITARTLEDADDVDIDDACSIVSDASDMSTLGAYFSQSKSFYNSLTRTNSSGSITGTTAEGTTNPSSSSNSATGNGTTNKSRFFFDSPFRTGSGSDVGSPNPETAPSPVKDDKLEQLAAKHNFSTVAPESSQKTGPSSGNNESDVFSFDRPSRIPAQKARSGSGDCVKSTGETGTPNALKSSPSPPRSRGPANISPKTDSNNEDSTGTSPTSSGKHVSDIPAPAAVAPIVIHNSEDDDDEAGLRPPSPTAGGYTEDGFKLTAKSRSSHSMLEVQAERDQLLKVTCWTTCSECIHDCLTVNRF